MAEAVTEILSGINDIHMTSKFLQKRLTKIIDDGARKCICRRDSDSLETEIRKLQSSMKSLEDKVSTRDESRLSNYSKAMLERLDVLESEFQLHESYDTASRNKHSNSNTKLRPHGASDMQHGRETNKQGNPIHNSEDKPSHLKSQALQRQTNTVSGNENATERTQSSDKGDVTKAKGNFILKDSTESVDRLKGTASESFDNRSKVTSNESLVGKYETNIKRNVAIRKPNFMKPSQSVGLIKQVVHLVHDGERYWQSLAQNEYDEYRTRYMFLEGVHSVICLDISESMANSNAWTEARTFITDYLTGLENMSKSHARNIKKEYVALVTFGHKTKIQVGYTDDFIKIEKELDNIKLGGPTQMYGGFLIALATGLCFGHQIERLDNGSHIFTKMIFISDGRPTEVNLIAGIDIADSSKIDETKAIILQAMEQLRKFHVDSFFVPVGKSDEEFNRTMAECSGGSVLDYRQGKRFSKRQYLTSRLLDPLGMVAGITIRGSDYDITNEDKEDLKSIQASAKYHLDDINREEHIHGSDVYNEIRSKQLPPIGSRVRRGPDWHYRIQDSNGPGTVIGHADNDRQVWVEWDANEYQDIYMYGSQGYDVLIVDEPRKLNPGDKIAVGCKVVPGKDWKGTNGSVRHGVVIKVNRREKKAKVRWNNGKRDSYLYDDLQEIKVKADGDTSSGSSRFKDESSKQGYELEPPKAMTIEEFAAKRKPKKNKNSL